MKKIFFGILAALLFNTYASAADFKPTLSKDYYGRWVVIPKIDAGFDKVEWWGDEDDKNRAQGEGSLQWTTYHPNGQIASQFSIEGTVKNGYWVGDRIEMPDRRPGKSLTYWLDNGKPFLAQTGIYPNLGNRYFTIKRDTFWDIEIETDAASFYMVANNWYEGKFPKNSSFKSLKAEYDRVMGQQNAQKAAEEAADKGPKGMNIPYESWPGKDCSPYYEYDYEGQNYRFDILTFLSRDEGATIDPLLNGFRKPMMSYIPKTHKALRYLQWSDWHYILMWPSFTDKSRMNNKQRKAFRELTQSYYDMIVCYAKASGANSQTYDIAKMRAFEETTGTQDSDIDAYNVWQNYYNKPGVELPYLGGGSGGGSSSAGSSSYGSGSDDSGSSASSSSGGSSGGKKAGKSGGSSSGSSSSGGSGRPGKVEETAAPYVDFKCIDIQKAPNTGVVDDDHYSVMNNCNRPMQVLFCEERNFMDTKCNRNMVPGSFWSSTGIIYPNQRETIIRTIDNEPKSAFKAIICDMSNNGSKLCVLPTKNRSAPIFIFRAHP